MRVSEVYLSIQGEGPRAGLPTVFVRFGGCNLRCAGWPCDTPHAIDAELYRKEWKKMSPYEVFEEITVVAGKHTGYSVCLTGGEPFLQPKDAMDDLINLLTLELDGMRVLECFSNGTLPYSELARQEISFIMDWKLPGCGEEPSGERILNFGGLSDKDVVKFTIKDRADYEEARNIYFQYNAINDLPMWYYGCVWGELEDQELIGWVLEDALPWVHTMQTHNYVWNRELRGI